MTEECLKTYFMMAIIVYLPDPMTFARKIPLTLHTRKADNNQTQVVSRCFFFENFPLITLYVRMLKASSVRSQSHRTVR